MSKENENKEIGALWIKTSAKGNTFSSGYVEVDGKRLDVVVFKNSFKQEGEKTPDARIYLSEKRDAPASPQVQEQEEQDVPF